MEILSFVCLITQFSLKFHKSGLSLSQDAIEKLQRQNWPGNIRELSYALERAVLLATID